MKLMHLSDLHLGKRVNEFSMIGDQKFILQQILKIVGREQPDAVLIAGDVYDRTVPPVEAVQLLDWFLQELSDRGQTVCLINGNHDSAERLAFGSSLFESQGIHIAPVYGGRLKKVTLEDRFGPVHIYLMPFLRPSTVRHAFPEAEIGSSQEAAAFALSQEKIDRRVRNVLVAHQFVAGASRCESEEQSVGGLDQIAPSVFGDFDYVALGHIHSPQSVGRETVRYCGTPLKYSFSESGQEKSMTVAELGEKGDVRIRAVSLAPLRDMRRIRGSYLEVTARSFYEGTNTEDYLQITLTDEEDVPDGVQKLRVIYPNLMQLAYDNCRTGREQQIGLAEAVEEKSELEVFGEFYEVQNNRPMDGWQTAFVREQLERPEEGTARRQREPAGPLTGAGGME